MPRCRFSAGRAFDLSYYGAALDNRAFPREDARLRAQSRATLRVPLAVSLLARDSRSLRLFNPLSFPPPSLFFFL